MLVNAGAFAVRLTFLAFEEVTYSLQSFMQCCICQPIRFYDILWALFTHNRIRYRKRSTWYLQPPIFYNPAWTPSVRDKEFEWHRKLIKLFLYCCMSIYKNLIRPNAFSWEPSKMVFRDSGGGKICVASCYEGLKALHPSHTFPHSVWTDTTPWVLNLNTGKALLHHCSFCLKDEGHHMNSLGNTTNQDLK